jgi:hypothetical protein
MITSQHPPRIVIQIPKTILERPWVAMCGARVGRANVQAIASVAGRYRSLWGALPQAWAGMMAW